MTGDEMKVFISLVLGAICSLTWAGMVHAEDCNNLDSNEIWVNEFSQLREYLEEGHYDKALENANRLNTICSRSPILNYAYGKIYKAKGDNAKSLYFLQRATLFTEEFAVKGEMLERLWSERYEAEHPEATPGRIKERDQEIQTLQENNARLENELRNASIHLSQTTLQDSYEEQSRYAVGLWTGVALGGAGIIMTVTGAALWAKTKDDAIKFEPISSVDDKTAHVKGENNAYWGLLGAGIGLTVAGSVIAGISGYFYARSKPEESDTSFDLAISPMGVGLTGRF